MPKYLVAYQERLEHEYVHVTALDYTTVKIDSAGQLSLLFDDLWTIPATACLIGSKVALKEGVYFKQCDELRGFTFHPNKVTNLNNVLTPLN